MNRLLCVVACLACACGSSGSGGTDAGGGGGDDGGGDQGDSLGAGSHAIELTLTNRPNDAAKFSFVVAYQDGGAPWQVAPAPTGDTYSFAVTAPSYGVMYACIGSTPGNVGATQTRAVTAAHFAVAERTHVTLDVPPRCSDRMPSAGMAMLTGSVTNRPGGGGVIVVSYGTRTVIANGFNGGFSMQVPMGVRDLVVFHAISAGNGDFHIDQVATLRDVNVAGATTQTIDFSTASAADSYDVQVSATNARVVATTTLYTANGTQAMLTRESSNWESDALPDPLRRPTDVYDQSIAVLTQGHGATVTNATSTPGALTYSGAAPLGDVTASVASTTPYPIIETAWSAYDDVIGYMWTATQTVCPNNVACSIAWTAYLSPGVSGTSPGYRMPDLSALAGWKADYAFRSATIGGSVTAITSSAGPMDFPTQIPAAGTQRVFVRTDFDVTP